MATGSNAVEVLHVLGASVVVGYYAILPMAKAAATKAGEPGVMRHFLVSSRDAERRVVLPALALVLLTGIALTVGPFERLNLERSRTMQVAILLTLVLGVLLYAGLSTPGKKMLDLLEKGEGQGPAMDKLWGEWRTALLAGALLAALATGVMVWQGA